MAPECDRKMQLAQQVADVRLDGALGDKQLGGDSALE
jgi:hypothetical protein